MGTSGTVTSGYASLTVASGSPDAGCNGDDTPHSNWGPLFRKRQCLPKPGHTPASCRFHSSPYQTGIAMVNASSQESSVTITRFDASGTKVAQATT